MARCLSTQVVLVASYAMFLQGCSSRSAAHAFFTAESAHCCWWGGTYLSEPVLCEVSPSCSLPCSPSVTRGTCVAAWTFRAMYGARPRVVSPSWNASRLSSSAKPPLWAGRLSSFLAKKRPGEAIAFLSFSKSLATIAVLA